METPFKIFIVEDDRIFSKMLAHHLSLNPDYQIETFETGKAFLERLHENPDMVSLDYNLPGTNGLEVLKKIKRYNSDLPVVIVSGQQDINAAISIFKMGVYDYITKDENTKDRLWNITIKIREKLELKKRVDTLEAEVSQKFQYSNLIKGHSEAIQQVFRLIDKAVKTNINVSIIGETGTGKELVAKSIHYNSARNKKPFVPVNVSAIPDELVESEFFGHEKGAFTGAHTKRIGKFEQANGGTLFLDEIGDMDLNMQAKLLRVLQEGEIVRVGSNKSINVDVRIISATYKNLEEEVHKGAFREDLFYRIQGLPIHVLPLRQRRDDIPLLADYFLEEFCKNNRMKRKRFSKEAVQKLKNYTFPGNVRELKAIVDTAAVMADSKIIKEKDILFSSTSPIEGMLAEERTLGEYNNLIVKHYLQKYNNNVRHVAALLDVGKTTIYRMMKNGVV
jgi:DNA-binding NtrC family response regulator